MPLKNEERIEIDIIAKNLELFKVYKSKRKDKVLAIIQIKGQEPQLFMSQNIPLYTGAGNSSKTGKGTGVGNGTGTGVGAIPGTGGGTGVDDRPGTGPKIP